jgi:hypothetical protein
MTYSVERFSNSDITCRTVIKRQLCYNWGKQRNKRKMNASTLVQLWPTIKPCASDAANEHTKNCHKLEKEKIRATNL